MEAHQAEVLAAAEQQLLAASRPSPAEPFTQHNPSALPPYPPDQHQQPSGATHITHRCTNASGNILKAPINGLQAAGRLVNSTDDV